MTPMGSDDLRTRAIERAEALAERAEATRRASERMRHLRRLRGLGCPDCGGRLGATVTEETGVTLTREQTCRDCGVRRVRCYRLSHYRTEVPAR